jgi:CRP/FNR family cyclic AMP-dependent transcriptional regulator
MPLTDLLRRMFLFADLRDDELVALSDCVRRRVFAKDAILFQQDSPARNLYLIASGAVRLFAHGELGQELILDVYGPGECIGETSLLDGNLRIVSAAALEKTITYTMSRDDFLHCLELHPQMAWRVMVLLARRLEKATAYAENLVFLSVAGRVAAVMLELAARHGTEGSGIEFDLHLTQADLANWVGASREMVNKVLHAYRDQGLITMEGHTIVITDLTGLTRKTEH